MARQSKGERTAKIKRARRRRAAHAEWMRQHQLWREAQRRLAAQRQARIEARLWYLRGEGAAF
jgi:hypothetical protein